MPAPRPCGHDDAETYEDNTRGVICCNTCGLVLEDNPIVSEVQFEESAHGGASIVGQMVGDQGFKGLSVGGLMGTSRESRQITLDNARKRIRQVGAQIRLNKNSIEMAFNFYKRALQKRLTHGRKHTHVIAACVYITCRIEQTSHMLLDLSDVMQVNVYELGRTYLKLSTSLRLNIPAIDPCLYIYRFSQKLDLGEKSHDIEMAAMRIAQRMKRDWMHLGRRPSGLCGAALLVAARLHDTHCAVKDIIKVVKVCEATIRKRLSEFGDTPTSKLTLEEFMHVDLEGEEDPPCFKAARKRTKLDQDDLDEVEINRLQEVIERELEKSRPALRGPWAKYAKEATATAETAQEPKTSTRPKRGRKAKASKAAPDSESQDSAAPDEDQIAEKFIMEENLNAINQIINEGTDNAIGQDGEASPSKGCGALGLRDISSQDSGVGKSGTATPIIDTEEEEELHFSDLDDGELDSYILNDNEAKVKKNIWERMNADWIKETAEKEKRRAEEEAIRKEKEERGELPPKKKRRVKKKFPIKASTADEAMGLMLMEKRLSNKINYDVLRALSGSKEEKTADQNAAIEVKTDRLSVATHSILSSISSMMKTSSTPSTPQPTTSTKKVSFAEESATKRLPSLKQTSLSLAGQSSSTPATGKRRRGAKQLAITVNTQRSNKRSKPTELPKAATTTVELADDDVNDTPKATELEPTPTVAELEKPKDSSVPAQSDKEDEEYDEETDVEDQGHLSISQLMSGRAHNSLEEFVDEPEDYDYDQEDYDE